MERGWTRIDGDVRGLEFGDRGEGTGDSDGGRTQADVCFASPTGPWLLAPGN